MVRVLVLAVSVLVPLAELAASCCRLRHRPLRGSQSVYW
jgi:hypothetical protein